MRRISPSVRRIPRVLVDHWYVCGRKTRLTTSVIAELHAETYPSTVAPYPCPYGNHWHVGRRQLGHSGIGMNHARRQNARHLLTQFKERAQ